MGAPHNKKKEKLGLGIRIVIVLTVLASVNVVIWTVAAIRHG